MVRNKSTRFSFLPVPRHRPVRLVGFPVALLVAGLASGCAQTGSPDDLAYGRGENALAAGRHDDARSYLAEALARDPSDSRVLRCACLAWSTSLRQDPARVIESCRAYLEHASGPAGEDTEWDDAVARLITALVGGGDTAQARAWSARLRDPVTAATIEASLWLADDPSRSLAALAPALAADPEHARFHDVAAAVYEALGRDDEALHHLERSQAVDPLRSDLYQRLAGLAARVGDAERAALETARAVTLARYEALAETDPETDLETDLETDAEGDTASGSERDAERLRLLIRLDEAFPRRHPLIRFAKARLELRLGHTDRGRKRVEGLVRQKLLTDGQRLALATLFQAEDRHGIVRDWLEPMLAADPKNEHARASLLGTLLALNALPAARVLLEEGVRLHPHRAHFHAMLAQVTLRQGSTAGYEKNLRRAIDLSPWDPGPRTVLASFMLARGRRDGARQLIADAPFPSPELAAFAAEHEIDTPSG